MREASDIQAANFDTFAVCMIASWYISNIGVLLLNKYLLSLWGFKYPIFLTMLHMLSCLILSIVVRLTGLVPRQHIRNRRHMFKVSVLSLVFVVSVVGGISHSGSYQYLLIRQLVQLPLFYCVGEFIHLYCKLH